MPTHLATLRLTPPLTLAKKFSVINALNVASRCNLSPQTLSALDKLKVSMHFCQKSEHMKSCSFLKPFLKGKNLRSSERGVNSILTTILRF